MKKQLTVLLILSLMLFSLNGCLPQEEALPDVPDEVDTPTQPDIPTAEAASFAEWQDNTVDFTPSVPKYEIESDLSNVTHTDILDTPDSAKAMIAENGFVVADGWDDEFFSLYEENRYSYVPSFITTDSVLHTYHLYFNYLLKTLEEEELYETALDLTNKMMEASLAQYDELKGTEFEDSAEVNVGFFAVALSQIDPDAQLPSLVEENALADAELMKAHSGIAKSNVLGEKEDFSQYIPRGHYTKSEKLKRYFNALMWYGRITMTLENEDATKSALLMMSALHGDEDILKDWRTLYEPIGFFVGEPDDLVYHDYLPVALDVYGGLDLDLLQDGDLDAFVEEAKKLRDPGVNSMPILGTVLAPDEGVEERTAETKGFRFMGQRFTIDASVFQKLICREVGNKDGTMPCPASDSRMLPMGLDVTSAFGSDLSYELLDEMGETEYEKYPENMAKLQEAIGKLPMSQWTTNLYWGWMYTLKSLLEPYGEGYPMFMQSDEWKKKELNTFLGSWAELKHDTILYAKQVYAEMGGGPFYEERDFRGYVEPNPELYARLASLTQLTVDGLDQRGILSSKNKEELERLYDMLIILRDISVKELEGTNLSEEEYEFIETFGGSLEHLWDQTFTDEERSQTDDLLRDNPAALIADVATDPNCCVLEVGIGNIDPIYVVFPIDGELRLGKGGVFSYYEFSWPMDDRLTDEKWRDEVLNDWENPPKRPSWQTYFLQD